MKRESAMRYSLQNLCKQIRLRKSLLVGGMSVALRAFILCRFQQELQDTHKLYEGSARVYPGE